MIPFVDLQAQYLGMKDEIDAAAARVLRSGQFVLGPEVEAFETEFAAYCGARYGVAVNSGTSALHLALLAAGVGAGDEVITVPFTFVATAAAIGYAGARPVFVDVDPRSCTMDPARIEGALTGRTRAIVPVHLYGQPADMEPILAIARSRNIAVIEDAAQAHGAEYRGRRVGGLGDLGCFSFYPSKNLGACGEGGIVVTSDPGHARTLRMLRDWGQEEKGRHVLKGYNYRMEGLQGAILRAKLRHLEDWIRARRRNAALYDELLAGAGVQTPVAAGARRHVYHLYTIRSARRGALRRALQAEQIQSAIHYPIPVHLQQAWAELGHRPGDFPHSERAAGEVLSLPVYPELPEPSIERVARAVRTAMGSA